MSCEEKREMYRLLIDRIDMYAEKTADGRVIKSISFKFPVFYGDQEPGKDADPDDTVTYTLDASEIGVTVAEAKATYTELKSYILEKYGVKVSSLYIAQIKRKYGIEVGENYNKPADANARVPKCPKAKEEIIVDALKHFRMLDEDVEIME
jgi:site-specific DNA recombinase